VQLALSRTTPMTPRDLAVMAADPERQLQSGQIGQRAAHLAARARRSSSGASSVREGFAFRISCETAMLPEYQWRRADGDNTTCAGSPDADRSKIEGIAAEVRQDVVSATRESRLG